MSTNPPGLLQLPSWTTLPVMLEPECVIVAVPVPLQDVDSSAFEKFPEKVHVPVRLRAGPLSGPVESPPPHPIIKRQSERAMLLMDTSNMYRAKEQPVGEGLF